MQTDEFGFVVILIKESRFEIAFVPIGGPAGMGEVPWIVVGRHLRYLVLESVPVGGGEVGEEVEGLFVG